MNNTYLLPPVHYPLYHFAREHVFPPIPDVCVSIAAPFVAYWVLSSIFHLVDISHLSFFEQYRIHESEEAKSRNLVSVGQVVRAVLFQQLVQTVLGLLWLKEDDKEIGPFRDHQADLARYFFWLKWAAKQVGVSDVTFQRWGGEATSWLYWWGIPVAQFFFAAFLLDAWQYVLHRAGHENKWLYRNFHSTHHRLYVPYAFGALYNHPLEGFFLDTVGATLAHTCARMTARQGIVFFLISTAKTVDDHCGFSFPWDPFQFLFVNNVDYHDIHHQIGGFKHNYSQPYFIHFDYFLGTKMTREQFEAKKYRSKGKLTQKED